MQRGTPVLPKSVTLSRIDENLKSKDVKLDGDDIAQINNFKPHVRYFNHSIAKPLDMSMEEYWDGEFLV